jgi:hypothetical protein
MTISKHQAIHIARDFLISRAMDKPYPLKDGIYSAELQKSNTFSQALGVDCVHWNITFEIVVPEDMVVCPDLFSVLVSEASGEATLATLM